MSIRRVGTFKVSNELLREENIEVLLKFFANMVVVRTENLFLTDCIQYTAFSPLFREADTCAELPEYMIFAHKIMSDDGTELLEFEAKEIQTSERFGVNTIFRKINGDFERGEAEDV